MASDMIKQMVAAVERGFTPRSVVEATLVYKPGSNVKVNKSTTGVDYHTKASVTIPEGTLVSVVGVGAGPSGVDHHVMLPDGKQVIIPFADLGESILKRARNRIREMELLTGSVVKVSMIKPLPQSVLDWLQVNYMDFGVELPPVPLVDDDSSLVFMMKGESPECLETAIDDLKSWAGASFKSADPVSLTDWSNPEGATLSSDEDSSDEDDVGDSDG